MKSKAQASVEYLMVLAFALVILVPLAYIFYSKVGDFEQDVALGKIDRIGNTIINTAERVHYLGPPSKSTITLDFPPGVTNVSVLDNKTLVIRYREADYYFDGTVNLVDYIIERDYTEGQKKFRVESLGNQVALYVGSLQIQKILNFIEDLARAIIRTAESLKAPNFGTLYPMYSLRTLAVNDSAHLIINLDSINLQDGENLTFDLTIDSIQEGYFPVVVTGGEFNDIGGVDQESFFRDMRFGAVFSGLNELYVFRQIDSDNIEVYGSCMILDVTPDYFQYNSASAGSGNIANFTFTTLITGGTPEGEVSLVSLTDKQSVQRLKSLRVGS